MQIVLPCNGRVMVMEGKRAGRPWLNIHMSPVKRWGLPASGKSPGWVAGRFSGRGRSLCRAREVFSGDAGRPSMMLRLPMLMFIQEGALLRRGGRGPASCENTVKEALVLISRILEVYLLKGKKEINGLCAELFLIVLPWLQTSPYVPASACPTSRPPVKLELQVVREQRRRCPPPPLVFWDHHLARETCAFPSEPVAMSN